MPPNAIVGIKLDADGCLLDDGRGVVHVPAYSVKVVDTTGAGDAWFAGLITGFRRNLTLEQCGKLANRVAADCCTALGASAGVRSLLRWLQAPHAATVLSQVLRPPRERGTTWSMVEAPAPQ